jgi:hypothetical protein
VIAARNQRDIVTVLRQASTDDSADAACTVNDEPHAAMLHDDEL